MSKDKVTHVRIFAGYAGKVVFEANVNEQWFLLENDQVQKILQDSLNEKGFILTKTPRQRYTRIVVNEPVV